MTDYFSNGKICIRRFLQEDAASLYDAVRESIEDLCAWIVWCHPNYSTADSQNFIRACSAAWEQGGQFSFAISEIKTGMLLGSIGLNHLDRVHRSANIGYWVRKCRTREGIATAALHLVGRFGLQELGFNRLEILVPTDNEASQRAAVELGAKRLGVARKRLVLNGQPRDAVLYSLISEDLEGSRDPGHKPGP
jgi:RimJ/RimL family protein N-acetyltransferase